MNQIILKFDQYLLKNLKNKNIPFKICKGNVLNEIDEVKKNDGTPFKVFTPFWRNAEKILYRKNSTKRKNNKKMFEKKRLFTKLY